MFIDKLGESDVALVKMIFLLLHRYSMESRSKERLQMLYWLKKDAIATRKELSEKLGRDESTIYRWMRKYRQGGLIPILEENALNRQGI